MSASDAAGQVPDALLDAVADDTELTPGERETTVRFARDSERAAVFTAERGLARRLLQHPEAEIRGVVAVRGDARPEIDPREWDGERVVGVRCALPVGCLLVRENGRTTGSHSDIVTERVIR